LLQNIVVPAHAEKQKRMALSHSLLFLMSF